MWWIYLALLHDVNTVMVIVIIHHLLSMMSQLMTFHLNKYLWVLSRSYEALFTTVSKLHSPMFWNHYYTNPIKQYKIQLLTRILPFTDFSEQFSVEKEKRFLNNFFLHQKILMPPVWAKSFIIYKSVHMHKNDTLL